jgi:DNA polymerase-3 subunit chi
VAALASSAGDDGSFSGCADDEPGPRRNLPLSDPGRVDFYVLAAAEAAARLRFACRLTEKAYLLNQRVHLHTDSPAAAAELDELLWTFRQGSFVPHEVARAGETPQSPVTIGHGPAPPPASDVLINLAGDVPAFADACPRVAEIIAGSEEARREGRERFRLYRQAGREPATHNIGSAS